MDNIEKELSKFSTSQLKQEIFRRRMEVDDKFIDKIKNIVCEYYKVGLKCIHKKGRGAGSTACRKAKMALYYIFRLQKRSCKEIADIMKKDHSTVSVGARKCEAEMKASIPYRKEIYHLIELVYET